MKLFPIGLFCLSALGVSLGAAELEVGSLFAPNAVLQREQAIPVWGHAPAGVAVTIEFAGQKKSATTDRSGKWVVHLEPMPGSAEPRTLTVRAMGTEKPLMNPEVLVGDVWLYTLGSEPAKNAEAEPLPKADQGPPARVFVLSPKTAREVQAGVMGTWATAEANATKRLVAPASFLGRRLATEAGVPVGIIVVPASFPAESWMSREVLAATPEAVPILAYYASDAWKMRTVGTFEERLKAWTDYCQKIPLNPPPKPKPDDVDTLAKQEPSALWNATIAPLLPAAIRGIVWENGEDMASQNRAFQQGQLLPSLIASWRQAFDDPALPVAIVQIPPHRYAAPFGMDGRLVAELREAQRVAATATKSALVTTIDLGTDPKPSAIATRVTDTLLAQVYGKPERDPAGPRFAGAETDGDKITLRFTNTHGGLKARDGALKGFAIASSLYRWVWADAKIEGDTVILSTPPVPKPLGARYAYEDLPSQGATLTDDAGHPAAPFRTDDFLSVTGQNLSPAADVVRFNPRIDLGMEDPRLPRVLIIGDSISGHYLPALRERMREKASVIGESTMIKGTWGSSGPRFYRADTAAKGDDLQNYLAERGPFDIVHFNNGIHNFIQAKPGDEVAYAENLRKVVATIRASGAVCLFANSTGTTGDGVIPTAPNYLRNCQVYNAAAEALMKELSVPVTDIYGMVQPHVEEMIGSDHIHPTAKAGDLMADLIAQRLTETLATLPKRAP